jgi:hypothetical protein
MAVAFPRVHVGGVAMADAGYDKSIGTEDRSVVAATKLWAIIIGIVVLLGLGMILFFLTGSNMRDSGGPNSENTSTRPAEP